MTVAVIGTGKIGELVLSGLLRAGRHPEELPVVPSAAPNSRRDTASAWWTT
jgi:pyrroline-5-carboxylate reductase